MIKKEKTTADKSNKKQAQQEAPKPWLSFQCGAAEFEFNDLADFIEQDAQLQVRKACREGGETPSFLIRDIFSWQEIERRMLFSIIRDCKTYDVDLGRGSRSDLITAILEDWEPAKDFTNRVRDEQTLKDVAALAYPAGQEGIAGRFIAERAKAKGVTGLVHQVVAKEIRELRAKLEQSDELDPATPLAIAESYLDHLRKLAQLAPDEPPLRYFQDDFFRWTGTVWKRVCDGELDAEVTRFVQCEGEGETPTGKLIDNVVINLRGLCLVPEWEENRLPLLVSDDGSASPSPYLAFDNGLVNLEELLRENEASIDELHPRHFSTTILPYEFDSKATCPQWLKVLEQILPRQQAEYGVVDAIGDHRMEILQEAFGWCLLTGKSAINLEHFFILHGGGANGKSTVLATLEDVLGRENVSHVRLEDFDGDFRLYEIAHKLANINSDMNRPERVAEGMLKTLVSGEPIQVNRKYKDPLTIYPTAKLLFATNELPSFGDRSDGIWRRVTIIPFTVQIPADQRDKGLRERLRAELPGILNWAIEGAKRLIAKRDFTRCSVCERVRYEHRLNCDSILAFFTECTGFSNCGKKRVKEQELFTAYCVWCNKYLNGKAVGRPKFYQRMRDRLNEHNHNRPKNDQERIVFFEGYDKLCQP